jgi:hypothetical protein
MKTVASVLSYLFHPLLIPTYATFLYINIASYWFMLTDKGIYVVLSVVFLFTFILPVVSVPLYLYFRLINRPEMETSRERIFPMIFTALFYSGAFYMLNSLPLPSFFKGFMLASILIIILVLIITFYWKISAHLAALGGFTGSLVSFSLIYQQPVIYFLMAAIFISGLVAVARLIKEAHSQAQIYTGWLIGFLVSFLLVMFY